MSDVSPAPARSATLTVFRVAAVFTILAVALGAAVCATDSSASCPNWPGCRPSAIAPEWALSPMLEFTHRVVAVLTGPLVLAAAVMSLRVKAADRWVRTLPWVALLCAFASAVFGRMVIVSTLSTRLGAVDLCAALVCMTVTNVAAVRLGSALGRRTTPADDAAPAGPDAGLVTGLATAAVVTVIAMHVTGIFTAAKGSFTRCTGWPMSQLVEADLLPSLQGVRLALAAAASVLVVGTAVVARRDTALRPFGGVVGGLLAVEVLLQVWIRLQGLTRGLGTAYSVTAVLLLVSLALTAAVANSRRARTADAAPQLAAAGR